MGNMSTKLEEAIKQGSRARQRDLAAAKAKEEERAARHKVAVSEEVVSVRADKYELFKEVARATRRGNNHFTLSGSSSYGEGWSPEEAFAVADAIKEVHPEFRTRVTVERERNFCDDLYDRGSVEVFWGPSMDDPSR